MPINNQSQYNRQPTDKISRTAVIGGLVAVAAGAIYAGNKIYDFNQAHPPTTSKEEVEHNLGLDTDSAPALNAPKAPSAGELPEVVLSGLPENLVTVETAAPKQ